MNTSELMTVLTRIRQLADQLDTTLRGLQPGLPGLSSGVSGELGQCIDINNCILAEADDAISTTVHKIYVPRPGR